MKNESIIPLNHGLKMPLTIKALRAYEKKLLKKSGAKK